MLSLFNNLRVLFKINILKYSIYLYATICTGLIIIVIIITIIEGYLCISTAIQNTHEHDVSGDENIQNL